MMGLESIDLLPIGFMLAAIGLTLATLSEGWLARLFRIGAVFSAIVAALALLWNITHIVRPGTVNVQVLYGDTLKDPLPDGRHMVHPHSHFHEMVVRQQMIEFVGDDAIRFQDSSGALVSAEICIPYRLRPSAAPAVYLKLGPDAVYQATLRNVLRTALTDAARQHALTADAELTIQPLVQARVNDLLDQAGLSKLNSPPAIEIAPIKIMRICPPDCSES